MFVGERLVESASQQAEHGTTAPLSGCLFVLVGPSGVGKNTIMRDVMHNIDGMRQLPTATTRDPRPGEDEGVQHYFVSRERFEEMKASAELLEFQEVHPGKWYGVPRDLTRQLLASGDLLVADVDIYGAAALKKEFPKNVVTIFVLPPSLAALRERLRERGEVDLEDRFQRAEMEMSRAAECDYRVVNDVLERCVAEVTTIVQREIKRD
jgi:guanylate kinase